MKDIIGLILAVLILFGGCGQETESEEKLTVHLGELTVQMGDPAEPVLAELGQPSRIQEIPSCAFEGMETTYCYGSFYLTAYPGEDGTVIGSLWFSDDTHSTAEGIRIGDSREAVEASYGVSIEGNAWEVRKGNTVLTVLLTEDLVSSIQYQLLME